MKTIVSHIGCCIKARLPGIHIRTLEEERAIQALKACLPSFSPARQLLSWSMSTGITTLDVDDRDDKITGPNAPLEVALRQLANVTSPTILVLLDAWPLLDSPMFQRMLRESLAFCRRRGHTIVLVGGHWVVPEELQDDIHIVDLPLPTACELEEFTRSLCVLFKGSLGDKVNIDDSHVADLARACQGLTLDEARSVVSLAAVKYKAIDGRAVKLAIQEKIQIVERTGCLEYEEPSKSLDDIGGLQLLKQYVLKRRPMFSPEAAIRGIDAPKGVLLVGVPGTGKTLCARAISAAFQCPLLKLDAGKLFGSLVGESEKNLRMVLETAEAVAPCVLLVDEFEKGFGRSEGEQNGGTTTRMSGKLLSWMQDQNKGVYVVGTANDIDKLDMALIRKGRFDEIFVVDLPDAIARTEILRIHLGSDAEGFTETEWRDLASRTSGFTGSELKAVVQEARISAFDDGNRDLCAEDVFDALENTQPLSKTMPEQLEKLRKFCKSNRARPAALGSVEADAANSTSGIEV